MLMYALYVLIAKRTQGFLCVLVILLGLEADIGYIGLYLE